MRRRSRVLIVFLLVLAGSVPATAEEPPGGNPCVVSLDAPAVVCAEGTMARAASVALPVRGGGIVVTGFAWRNAKPTSAKEWTGACIEVFSDWWVTGACGVPLAVAIDPRGDTATIKGVYRDRHLGLGRVAVDLTLETAVAPPAAPTSPHQQGILSCSSAFGGADATIVKRPAAATGYVSTGRYRRIRGDAGAASIEHNARLFGGILAPPGCGAGEEEGPRAPRLFSCSGVDVYEPVAVGGICAGAEASRSVIVEATSRDRTRFTVIGTHADSAPGWIDPTDPSSLPYASEGTQTLCLAGRGRGFGFTMCQGGFGDDALEIDPLLRTARIQATFHGFGDYPFFGRVPKPLAFGRVVVDLTITGEPAQTDLDPGAFEFAGCGFGLATAGTSTLKAAGAATGTIAFQRYHGTLRGGPARPLPARLSSGAGATALTAMYLC